MQTINLKKSDNRIPEKELNRETSPTVIKTPPPTIKPEDWNSIRNNILHRVNSNLSNDKKELLEEFKKNNYKHTYKDFLILLSEGNLDLAKKIDQDLLKEYFKDKKLTISIPNIELENKDIINVLKHLFFDFATIQLINLSVPEIIDVPYDKEKEAYEKSYIQTYIKEFKNQKIKYPWIAKAIKNIETEEINDL